MGLEDLVADVHTRTHSTMTARNKQLLAEDIAALTNYSRIDEEQQYLLDDAQAALTYRSLRADQLGCLKQPYQTLAAGIGFSNTSKNLFSGEELTGFNILTQSRSNYTNRFSELKEYFTQGVFYSDALLCREHLRKDPYLRRRASKDVSFRQEVHSMLAEFDEYIDYCRWHFTDQQRNPVWERAKDYLFKAAAVASVAYATIPSSIF